MHRADKAVLRLAIGLSLAVLLAYGLALPLAFAVCALSVLLLCIPGPPAPLAKGIVTALIVTGLLMAGVLMVPLHEHAPFAGVVITAVLLFAVFLAGVRKPGAMTTFVVIALTVIPVAGVAEQALAMTLAQGIGLGLGVGALVNGMSHAFFPDPPAPAPASPKPPSADNARWRAMQATVVVLPVFLLALTNPAFYLAAIMKTVMLGQQASETEARGAGWELVGSTMMGGVLAAAVWAGLSLLPNLWMLVLCVAAAALWSGARLFRVRASRFPPSFWLNALITMFILLGPAIEDASVGRDPYAASIVRVSLFIGVSFYAWATVWVLDRWQALRVDREAGRHRVVG